MLCVSKDVLRISYFTLTKSVPRIIYRMLRIGCGDSFSVGTTKCFMQMLNVSTF